MRLVSYRPQPGEAWRAGIEEQGLVIAGSAVYASAGRHSEKLPTVRELLEAGPAALETVFANARQIFSAGKQELVPLDSIELGPPVPDPDKIVCLGLNYADHAAEAKMAIPEVPVLFAKFRNSLTGPYSSIVLPRNSTAIDYEAELAVVIGRTCKDVAEKDALSHVAGYTIMNDVTARDLQMRTPQWTAGKALDTFAPMGPGIVPAAEIPDPQTLEVITRLNGQERQHSNTAKMIFSVAKAIEFISSIMTLVPGDIIATGTPSGVGFIQHPPIFMHEGDLVEIEIERVGRIANAVVGSGGATASR
ncbi:MAG TPA: fumarylacetoacetate hydrolase family protein [Ktedonosporobacter sp.]|jgi:2-keto-4-pentenoate hydratase/2-oxohepta-3-ene-1,7-dioic acid hydratase in catechol pathway|nr:fumarylacetoacetate hydrolase family protein [Ktedonosporobacter sp.]